MGCIDLLPFINFKVLNVVSLIYLYNDQVIPRIVVNQYNINTSINLM